MEEGLTMRGKAVVPRVKRVRIPFADDQVVELRALNKDITRRPVTKSLLYVGAGDPRREDNWRDPTRWGLVDKRGDIRTLEPADPSDGMVIPHRYGRPGDEVVVTETWRPVFDGADRAGIEYRADNAIRWVTDEEQAWRISRAVAQGRLYWRAARFMPTWASRESRELISVTHQRLHQVDEADIWREGVGWETADRDIFVDAEDYFETAWNGFYGESHPWDLDGWVRRIEFSKEAYRVDRD
jgi:hypothetical protein